MNCDSQCGGGAAKHGALRANVHDYLVVPEADRYVSPILATVPVRPVAHHMSMARGIDPDFAESEQDVDGGLESGAGGCERLIRLIGRPGYKPIGRSPIS